MQTKLQQQATELGIFNAPIGSNLKGLMYINNNGERIRPKAILLTYDKQPIPTDIASFHDIQNYLCMSLTQDANVYIDVEFMIKMLHGMSIDFRPQGIEQPKQEATMLNLTKDNIIKPAVEAWFRNYDTEEWVKLKLFSIDHRNANPYESAGAKWKQCSLTDPNIPQTRPWQTVDDIPDEAWGGWIKYEERGVAIFVPHNILCDTEEAELTDVSNLKWKPKGSNPFKGEWRKCEVVC